MDQVAINQDMLLKAQMAAGLNQNQGYQPNPAVLSFMEMAARTSELPREVSEKYGMFFNKDSTTSNLSDTDIKSVEYLLEATVLAEVLTKPREEVTEQDILEYWGKVANLKYRLNKSRNGFLIKQAGEHNSNMTIRTPNEQKKSSIIPFI